MKKHTTKNQKGFTLIETLIAVLILALTVGALLTLTAGGFFSIRYAKNDIVASNLLQESLEYIRNTRDSASQQGMSWTDWLDLYQQCQTTDGCAINPYAQSSTNIIIGCPARCANLAYFPNSGFYGYPGSNVFDPLGLDTQPYETSFVRTITMELVNQATSPQLVVTARMQWLNGTNSKSASQSIILTPWNLQ
jgi:prepilin-type N-terminal cleavage/methylation domain-containing protein